MRIEAVETFASTASMGGGGGSTSQHRVSFSLAMWRQSQYFKSTSVGGRHVPTNRERICVVARYVAEAGRSTFFVFLLLRRASPVWCSPASAGFHLCLEVRFTF